MKDAGVKVETPAGTVDDDADPLDSANRLVALPVALSTPVMFYNKDAFKEAGVDPKRRRKPGRRSRALGKLVASGQACPYTTAQPAWILVENMSAWHNEPVVAEGKKASLAINGMLEVKHVAMLSSWVKARYLHLFGRDDEAIEHFAKGECAVLTAASGAWPTLQRQAGFDVVSPRCPTTRTTTARPRTPSPMAPPCGSPLARSRPSTRPWPASSIFG
jgi:sn-glycerol 3-phosphate transport system substrate-binding protein